MNARFNWTNAGTLIALLGLIVLAAAPARAADLPAGATCVNGVLMVPHAGAPGKEANWIPTSQKCEAADFAAMEIGAGAMEPEKGRPGVPGLIGKPGYGWQHPGTSK
jgi:hypothetical protein